MSEAESERKAELLDPNAGKKWTAWSVVVNNDGVYQCCRANVKDPNDVDYAAVEVPTFSRDEVRALIEFGATKLLTADQLVDNAFDNKYRNSAFRYCAQLNRLERKGE